MTPEPPSVKEPLTPITADYLLPCADNQGNIWGINFWDAMHYMAVHRGLPFYVTGRAVTVLMNSGEADQLDYETLRHHFMAAWRQAQKAKWLAECTPDCQKAEKGNTGSLRLSYRSPKRVYYFNLPTYVPQADPAAYIHKPRGYIENGWITVIKSVYAKRLLNFLLRKYQVDPSAPAWPIADLRREFIQITTQTGGPMLHSSRLAAALASLIELGLVQPDGTGCRLLPAVFNRLPPLTPPGFYPGQPVYIADRLTAQAQDPIRADLANHLWQLGHWSPLFFWRIYTDLENLDNTRCQYLWNLAQTVLSPADLPSGHYRHHLAWIDLFQRVI